MKKLISLSAVVMLGFAAFAQDTIPKSHSNPNRNNNLDTMTRSNNMPKDTSTKNWNNPHRTDSTGSSTTSTTMSSDSMNTSNSGNSNPTTSGTMNHDSSSMSNGNHNMDSTGRNTGTNSHSNTTTTTTMTSATKNTEDSVKAYEKTLTDRVMMKDDKMYMLKDGEATLLEKSYKLSSGAIVSTMGTVKYPGGKVLTLKNGQFIEIKPVTTTETGTKKINKTKKSTKIVAKKSVTQTKSN